MHMQKSLPNVVSFYVVTLKYIFYSCHIFRLKPATELESVVWERRGSCTDDISVLFLNAICVNFILKYFITSVWSLNHEKYAVEPSEFNYNFIEIERFIISGMLLETSLHYTYFHFLNIIIDFLISFYLLFTVKALYYTIYLKSLLLCWYGNSPPNRLITT